MVSPPELISSPGVSISTIPVLPTSHDAVPPAAVESSVGIESGAPPRSWSYIVLHHSGTEEGSVASIDAEHRQRLDARGRPWLGIGYHFVIGNGHGMADGEVQPTFRWREQLQGAHAGERRYNEQGIGICLIGDYDRAAPTPRQVSACEALVRNLGTRFEIAPDGIVRHADVKATHCPGRFFPFREVVHSYTSQRVTTR